MHTKTFLDILALIRSEEQRRAAPLEDPERGPEADDQWLFVNGPFIAELCLILLLAVWHEVEREIVQIAAKTGFAGRDIRRDEYDARVATERQVWRNRKFDVLDRLRARATPEWLSMEVLWEIANSYKHEPFATPSSALVAILQLDPQYNYAAMPESADLWESIALSLDLPPLSRDYCTIAETFITRADAFTKRIKATPEVSRIKPTFASLKPRDFLR